MEPGLLILDARDALVDYFDYTNKCAIFMALRLQRGLERPVTKRTSRRAGRYSMVELNKAHNLGTPLYWISSCDNFFHVNWGWGGQYNGYYLIDTLIPAGFHSRLPVRCNHRN
ncbi:MAG: C10 family peptidase [Bacteroidales bacterium]